MKFQGYEEGKIMDAPPDHVLGWASLTRPQLNDQLMLRGIMNFKNKHKHEMVAMLSRIHGPDLLRSRGRERNARSQSGDSDNRSQGGTPSRARSRSRDLRQGRQPASSPDNTMTLYYGSNSSNTQSILGNGLPSIPGRLGTGVYLTDDKETAVAMAKSRGQSVLCKCAVRVGYIYDFDMGAPGIGCRSLTWAARGYQTASSVHPQRDLSTSREFCVADKKRVAITQIIANFKSEVQSKILIYVEVTADKKLTLSCDSSDSIATIRRRIRSECKCDGDLLIRSPLLYFQSEWLSDDKRTLADYKVQDGSTLHVRLSIDILFVEGPKIILDLKPSDTVGHLKKKIEEATGEDYNLGYNLFFDGERLVDQDTIAEYDIEHNDAVHLMPQFLGS